MPQRAPNRDLVERYDGRAPDGTGRRHYFRRWNRIEKWKWGLTGLAVLIGGGWLLAAPLGRMLGLDAGGAYRYSHGPVASVHAAWDANCEACHRSPDGSLNPVSVRDRWLNLDCEKCHAAPIHHATMSKLADGSPIPKAGDNAYCASCHHDHQGRTNSLVSLTDAHCTSCHTSLKDFTTGTPQYHNEISGFATNHPEFRKLADEKAGKKHDRSIKFSHAAHMLPGGASAAKVGKKLADLKGQIPAATAGPDGLVQLSCESCHQLDAGRTGEDYKVLTTFGGQSKEAVRPPRAAGAYYLPVNFDLHCKACHPLSVAGSVTDADAKAAKTFTLDVPHRVRPDELKTLLTAGFAGKLLADGPVSDLPTAPFLRQNPAGQQASTAKLKETLTAGVEAAVRTAAGTCGQCHSITADQKVAPVRIPTVWFEHSKFDHAAHRGVGCADCHPTAYATPDRVAQIGKGDWEREPIHITGVDSCKPCHSPAKTVSLNGRKVLAGGVRHGCTDCHRYHNGDRPLEGRGAPAQVPQPVLKVEEFLLGQSPKKSPPTAATP